MAATDRAFGDAGLAEEHGRDLHRAADTLIRSIYEKQTAWSARHTAYELKLRAAYACAGANAGASAAWQRLLGHVGGHTRMVGIEPAIPYLGPQAGNTFVDGLLHLALRHDDWLRPLEEWEPGSGDARSQFGTLARHLLACYFVPAFMDAAWFEGFGGEGALHRDWFVHIAAGGNVRAAGGPTRLTKMAAHHFLEAPNDMTVVGAVRWGQVLALGGDETLARAVAGSRLGRLLPDEPFWSTVIHFFANNPGVERSAVGPMVDFVYAMRFGTDPQPRGSFLADAPEPDFTMKGRTLAALRRRVDEWHEQLARDNRRPRSAWEPTGIQGFHVQERDRFGSLNEWAIVELLNSGALQEEGREMHHCVFTYAPACQRGGTSIWSLRVRSAGEKRARRLLTIEVDNDKHAIVQVRGRCNKSLGSFHGKGRMSVAGEILRRWAQGARLSIRCAL